MALFFVYAEAATTFTVPTERRSFFELDEKGAAKLDKNGVPYQAKTDVIQFRQTFSAANTAFFVVDPWNDMPGNFLNEYYEKIIQNKILPLIQQASVYQFSVYIFTNDCKAIQPTPYSCTVDKKFHALVKKYPWVHIVSWQALQVDAFVEKLKKQGISNLIYTGFASNMCVIDRPTGMISMRQRGFSLYFIPEASAAVETKATWETGDIHHAMTQIISQSMAKLIQYREIDSALNTLSA